MTQEQIIRQIRVANHNNLGPLGQAMAAEAEANRDVQVESSRMVRVWRVLRGSCTVEQFRDEWRAMSRQEQDELLALI